VERSAVAASSDFAVGFVGLAEGEIIGDGHSAEQLGVVFFQAG
jgi:hypothetical protein